MKAGKRGSGFLLPTMTSYDVTAHVLRFGSCFELSKVANVDCFDDVSGFGVFSRVSRFGPLKA